MCWVCALRATSAGSTRLVRLNTAVENQALLDELSSLIDALNDAPQLIQLFVHRLLRGGKIAAIHSYRDAAGGARDLRAVFEPSELLTELVFALRAMNWDVSSIEYHKLCRAMPTKLTHSRDNP